MYQSHSENFSSNFYEILKKMLTVENKKREFFWGFLKIMITIKGLFKFFVHYFCHVFNIVVKKIWLPNKRFSEKKENLNIIKSIVISPLSL